MHALALSFFLLAIPPEAAPDDAVERARRVFEDGLAEDLAKRPPDIAASWNEANAAREAGNLEDAAALYVQILARAPDWSHAARRACSVRQAQRRREEALDLCRKAVAIDRSPENLTALASALLATEQPAATPVVNEALDLTREALRADPQKYSALQVQCGAAADQQMPDVLRDCASRMVALAPGRPQSRYFQAISAAVDGNLRAARAQLALAHAAGLPQAEYERLDALMASHQSWISRFGPTVLLVLAVWFSAFGVLVVSGFLLSHMALRQAAALPPEANAPASGSFLRRLYAAVLWASCLFYLASIPLVALSVLASAALVIYGFLLVGRIPVQLVAIILVASLVSVWSLFTSFFHRRKEVDPGLRLNPEIEPKLQRVLHEVAARVGTRPVDSVFLTPGTELAVFERGRMMKTLSRRGGERCLLLGVGLLSGFEMGPFRAVLAHEYGHFSNRDTAGGGFALAIRRSIFEAAEGLAQGGAATWYNPAWLFLNAFYRVFLRISHGASRLQEVLADRFAAFGYGADAFEKGLRHAVERAVVFDAHVQATLADAQAGAPVANFYTHTPAKTVDPAEVSTAVNGAWNRPMSPYDSHPPPMERIALVRKLLASPGRASDDGDEAWSLFQNRAAVEAQLTEHVRSVLAAQGLVLRRDASAA